MWRMEHFVIMLFSFKPCSGADITATDAKSYTPLMSAADEGHVDAFNVLLEKGSPIHKSVLHLSAEENHINVLQVI